jgi:NADPH:quinone reductase
VTKTTIEKGDPMKSIQVSKFGEPTAIVVQDVEDLQPQSGEVLIRVHAAGVNPADFLVVNGMFQLPPSLPFAPGFEAAGEIIKVAKEDMNKNSNDLSIGSRVLITLPYLRHGIATFGAFAEQLVVPVGNVVAIPDTMEYPIASALPVMYGTGYVALKHRAQLQSGEILLVTGASGATGTAAVQIGKRLGATVIATASGEQKMNRVKAMGADYVLDYRDDNMVERIKEITQGCGVNVAFETVGGDLFEVAIQSMAPEGRLLPIGMASGIIPDVSMIRVLAGNFSIVGTDFAHYTMNHLDMVRTALTDIIGWYRTDPNMFVDLVIQTIPLEDAANAIVQVKHGAGAKVVLTMS